MTFGADRERVAASERLRARVGLGLVPHAAFRAELVKLSATGLVDSEASCDGSTSWKLAGASAEERRPPD